MPKIRNHRRNKTYFLDRKVQEFRGRKLQSNRQVLEIILSKLENSAMTVKEAARQTGEELSEFWTRAEIPIISIRGIGRKIERLYEMLCHLRKNKNRDESSSQQLNEVEFERKLDELFDIAVPDVNALISVDKYEFLESQRKKERRGFIPPIVVEPDDEMTGPENFESANDKEEIVNSAVTDEIPSVEIEADDVRVEGCSQSSTSTGTSWHTGQEFLSQGSNYEDEMNRKCHPPKINIVTTEVAAALDRTRTTSRAASFILTAACRALGVDLQTVNVSASAIQTNRIRRREQFAAQLKENLQVAKCLTVHWDGKMIGENSELRKVERVAILLTGLGTEQLLGVPKITSSTGKNYAEAVVETLDEWGISDRVKALCFDTTAANTGVRNGACALIEKQYGREFLLLACRHHTRELIIANVFKTCWDKTIGPKPAVFEHFRTAWPSIDKENYEIGIADELISERVFEKTDEILIFIKNQFEVNQPRNDYREFLELSAIFLGGSIPGGIRFKKPGADSHARWLSKPIYSLKIFMFKEQFPLDEEELDGLREICIFIILFYLKAWFTAPNAIQAPQTDLMLMQDLIQYQEINSLIATAALAKLTTHLWYLSEELVLLALFDENVSKAVKEKMVRAVFSRTGSKKKSNKLEVGSENYDSVLSKDVSDFVSTRSLKLFYHFELDYDFLSISPDEWVVNESYKKCLKVFKDLKVVNDVAERGVALMQHFTDCLTKDEEQKQFVLQFASDHRKQYPNSNIQTFITKNTVNE